MRTDDILFARRWRLSKIVQRAKRDFAEEEEGSLIIFTLFIFVLILFIAGMAVDMMRYETRRVAMQNTLDGAILAASSLTQDETAEDVVKDWVSKAGFDPNSVTVTAVDEMVNDIDLVGRTVSATSTVSINTMFMNMLGVGSLNGPTGGAASEGIQNVEISLVLDISGSMGWNGKMGKLKVAAKEFVDVVFENNANSNTVSISIVPYNAVVVTGSDLLNRLNADGTIAEVSPTPTRAGEIRRYRTEHDFSTCVRFYDTDFGTREISATTPLERISHFRRNGGTNDSSQPQMWSRWCNEERTNILVHSSTAKDLKDHIDGLSTGGWTAIDVGMKWGTALLDPAIQPVINDMVIAGEVDANAASRPGQYDEQKTLKVVVLMTDGKNTDQRDLKAPFKNGPTRIWYSRSLDEGATLADGTVIAEDEFDGFLVEMPDNPIETRWYLPGLENVASNNDRFFHKDFLSDPAVSAGIDAAPWAANTTYAVGDLVTAPRVSDGDLTVFAWDDSANNSGTPTDGTSGPVFDATEEARWIEIGGTARQLDYIELYDRFSVPYVAEHFFSGSGDNAAYTAHQSAQHVVENGNSADDRLEDICDAAKKNGDIRVYAIGFEAPPEGLTAMENCASLAGDFYDVSGENFTISDAFKSIAGSISALRLKE